MRKTTLILMILLLVQTVYGAENYIKGVIWLKVKSEYRGAETDKNSALFVSLSGLKVKSFGRKFPKHEPPREKLSADGQPLADLSLMFELVLEEGADENEAITKLLRTQQLEYAERKRYYSPLYMPNDPAAQTSGDLYTILNLIKAYQAWDVHQGDSTVSVAVLDTGVEWAIPELGKNIKYNLADPINGIDDDGNGYADDYRGWDMANNDNDPTPTNPHGTNVSGISSARGNNGIGVVGTGLRCKLLPIKVYANDNTGSFGGFEGIVYAADMGCKAINMSWGNPYVPLLSEQEIINYATLNKNVVVVAAGGNTPAELDFYPASYRNILSVVHTDVADQRNYYATYSRYIDMTAPGASVYGVTAGGAFGNIGGGSSFAAPMVAGAAALVYSAYPSLTAQQVTELLRVNSDNIDQIPANVPYAGKMGTGRLNMQKAMNKTFNTAVRVTNQKLTGKNGAVILSPDTAKLVLTFTNYLSPVANLNVSISTESSYISLLNNSCTVNSLATLASYSNTATPFKFLVVNDTLTNLDVWFTVKFQGANYSDYQHVKVTINNGYANLDLNQIATSVGANGRLGYVDDNSQKGKGMKWGNFNFIYESGLVLGYSQTRVSDCLRGVLSEQEKDFVPLKPVRYDINTSSKQQVSAVMADSAAVLPLRIRIKQTAYEYKQAPQDKNFVVEYELQNLSGQTYDSLHVGVFTDFDIMIPTHNRTEWNSELNLGYSYALAANTPYVGVQLLSPQEPSFYAIDNANAVDSNNIYMVDGFSDQEKYITLSRGVYRQHAGFLKPTGSDVLQVNGAKLRNFLPNEKRKVAFSFVVGNNYNDLKSSALQIKANFKIRNMSPVPSVANMAVCQPYNVTVLPTNGSKFRFYSDASLNTLIHEGSFYNIAFTGDSTKLYITCADSLFESYAQPITVRWDKANGQIGTNPSTLNLAFHTTATFTDLTAQTNSRTWDLGTGFAQTQTQVTRTFTQTGTYPIRLAVQNTTGCIDTVTLNYQVINDITATDSPFENSLKIYPNPNTGIFTLVLPPNVMPFRWTIYDLQGKELAVGATKQEQEQIILPALPDGCYYMRVWGDKTQKTLPLYIQH
ncbi:S8 family serine peptidase [Flexibacter flexilis]|nr:S8 family serine peptidase [Flexibacter flexilis]